MDQFGQFNYVGVGVTRGPHSSTPVIHSGSATYQKVASNVSSVVINYGAESYNLDMSDIFIDIGVGIGSVGIRSDTQIIINTESTENPNVQVGDIVRFTASSGNLTSITYIPNHQLSRVVGVGTYYFIIEDNIRQDVSSANGNCTVQKFETFLPTGIGDTTMSTINYRGAICLNDNSAINNGDFDDFILRCHSAILSGSSVAFFQFSNNGAFYGPPVTSEKNQREDGAHNGEGYIFGKDNVEGNDADADGGIGQSNDYYKRLSNTFYRYSIPSTKMRYINGGVADFASGNPNPSGQNGRYSFGVGGGYNRIYINFIDADGKGHGNFFYNTIGRGSDYSGYPDPTLWNFKVTSLETKSPLDIYSSERSYVWCKIISDSSNGNAYQPTSGPLNARTTRILYSFEVIACNINISSGGSPPNIAGFGGALNGTKPSIIEWFKSDDTSTGNDLTFHASIDGSNDGGIAFSAQKVQNNTWTHIVKKFERGDINSNSNLLGNLDRDILPNLDYRVWAFSRKPSPEFTVTSRPYLKIINHPDPDAPNEPGS